jgi:hypothetical protein
MADLQFLVIAVLKMGLISNYKETDDKSLAVQMLNYLLDKS